MARTKKKCGKENKRPAAKATPPNRPRKLSLWSDEAVVGAMKAVKEGRMSINRSALEFGVPRTTLKDRIAGRVVHGTNIGPKKYLSQEEEHELVNFLIKCSKIGYGKTRGENRGSCSQKERTCVDRSYFPRVVDSISGKVAKPKLDEGLVCEICDSLFN